jgi:hypothetical protein
VAKFWVLGNLSGIMSGGGKKKPLGNGKSGDTQKAHTEDIFCCHRLKPTAAEIQTH